jgi:hypothetical protein
MKGMAFMDAGVAPGQRDKRHHTPWTSTGVLLRLRAWPTRRTALRYWPAAAPGQRRVLLHAGLHKTGSTALQQFLSSATATLRARGLLYPVSGRSADYPLGHHNIAWQLAGDRRFRSSIGTLDDVAAEIAAFPGDAILSSEDFESVLGTPARLTTLIKHPLLKNHAFTVLFWAREQASYFESLFFEMLRYRMAQEAERICDALLAHGQVQHEDWIFHFDYHAIWHNLLALPATVVVRPYRALAACSIVADWLTFAELASDYTDPTEPEQRANPRSNLAEALSLFCQQRLGLSLANHVAQPEALAQLLYGRTTHLSSSVRAVLISRFAAENRRLARACGFAADALAIPRHAPAGSIPLEALFSLRTQSTLADLGYDDAADLSSALPAAVDTLLQTVWR